MKKYFLYNLLALLLVVSACKDDDEENLIDFSVSFSEAQVSLAENDSEKDITLSFSRAATEAGTITVSYTGSNAVYSTDFTTVPAGNNGSISVPVAVGDLNTTITFNKLQDPIEGTTKAVALSLDGFDQTTWVNGSTTGTNVSFTPIAATSGVINGDQGGSNQPNQVYVDLSANTQTSVRRDTWEIAFFNGDENRVFLNASLLVTAAEIKGVTDLLAITEASDLPEALTLGSVTVNTVQELLEGLPVSYSQYGDLENGISFTDNKEGTLQGTALAEVSTTAADNNVFIVGLGAAIPTEAAETGSIKTTGDHRGYMKVRVLTDGNSYTLQYAPLAETNNITEVTINKDSQYNQTAFSLSNGETVTVEPQKGAWDLNLSGVFSFYGPASFGGPPITAGLTYSDYVLHNTLGGVGLYQVTTYAIDRQTGERTDFEVPSYADFNRGNVDESALVFDDRAVIGSGWRSVFGGARVKDDRYFILKDADDNFYKLRFTAFTNDQGERGYPQFTYERL